MERCNCIKEKELSELQTLAKRNKSDIEQLNKKSEGMNDLSLDIKELSTEIKHMNSSLRELKQDVKELKEEKGKWYDKFKYLILSMLVGSAVTLFLTQIMGGN